MASDRGLFAVNLGKRYGSRPVVRGVNLALQRGEVVGLLGPNGAGKTTCFYMITGLIAPNEGRINLDSRDITALPMYRRARLGVGYLSQEPSVFRGLSVENNIRAVLEIVESSRSRRKTILEALLEEFAIAHSCVARQRSRCRVASDVVSRSLARWLAIRSSSSSTNRLRASTRLRSTISAAWWCT